MKFWLHELVWSKYEKINLGVGSKVIYILVLNIGILQQIIPPYLAVDDWLFKRIFFVKGSE